jgi:hypothetical protein
MILPPDENRAPPFTHPNLLHFSAISYFCRRDWVSFSRIPGRHSSASNWQRIPANNQVLNQASPFAGRSVRRVPDVNQHPLGAANFWRHGAHAEKIR